MAPFYIGIERIGITQHAKYVNIYIYIYVVICTLPTHAYILTFIINMAYKLSNISYLGSVHCHKTLLASHRGRAHHHRANHKL